MQETHCRVAFALCVLFVSSFVVVMAVLVPLNFLRHSETRASEWQSTAKALHLAVARVFTQRVSALELISAALVAYDDDTTPPIEVFNALVKSAAGAIEGGDVGFVEYIPRVRAADLRAWEQRILKAYPTLLSSCNISKGLDLPYYYPIAYITPLWVAPNVRALCFNIISRAQLEGPALQATTTGRVAASLPVQLIQGGTATLLYFAARSVTNANRTIALLGFVLRPEFFSGPIMADSANRKVAIFDVTASPFVVMPFANETTSHPVVAGPPYVFCANYTIGDRIWHMCQLPTQAYLDQNVTFYPVGVTIVSACCGLALVLVALAFGLSQYRREQTRRREREEATIQQARVEAKVSLLHHLCCRRFGCGACR